MIGFNKPYITGNEFEYMREAVKLEKISGNGFFTKKCHEFFGKRYGFKRTLLTHSCTAALEMAAILLEVGRGDEIIIPSYTFVSTANAFLLRGATIVFADSNGNNPNVDVGHISSLITQKTKAIVVVHYAGIACDMDPIMDLAKRNGIFVIEDAAQAIDSFYKNRPLGSIGHLAAFSFHETKNIISGEGGMLVINDEQFSERAEIIWEKGTNRSAFFKGEVDKYSWIDKGSSFLPSELTAAFLYAQLECLDAIQQARKSAWQHYFDNLQSLNLTDLTLPKVDAFAAHNAHLFFIMTSSSSQRDRLLSYLKEKGVQAIFHYLPLHMSPYYKTLTGTIPTLPNAECYGDRLIRLPLYTSISVEDLCYIEESVAAFFRRKGNQFSQK